MCQPKVLFIFGTRPEAIKLCPLVLEFRKHQAIATSVCVTAQHREMLDQVLGVFGVRPERDLGSMLHAQTLFQSTSRILAALEPVFADGKPQVVIVQGDTTSTLCGALAGFYAGVPVAHVEAGLRTGDLRQPFPEEMNRVVVSRLASLHFAPTASAGATLLGEGVPRDSVHVTGNTGIDAVLHVTRMLERGELSSRRDWSSLPSGKRLIAVTAHRRESFGPGFRRICEALRQLALRPDVHIVYPVHPNPNVSAPVRELLREQPNISLVESLDYITFVDLMRRAYLLLTDSGGIQEEGPSLGKPILVLREKTERPEAVEAGAVSLVGTDPQAIVASATRLLDDQREYARRARTQNPYGDGHACERIVGHIRNRYGF